MKNSEIKIISIILCIAVFFTILTSAAVPVATVIFFAKDKLAVTDTADTQNTQDADTQSNGVSADVQNDSLSSGVFDTNTTDTNNQGASTNNGTSDTNTQNNTNNNSAVNNNANTNTDANKPSSNGNAAQSTGAIDKEALAMFQKAAKEINDNAVAGFTKKNWQTVAAPLQLTQLPSLSERLSSMIESFMTSEADAEEKVSAKGSDDAKNRMPACNATEATIKSVTKKEDGSNIVITIVMKDSLNPGLEDKDGVTAMSDDLLYIKYVTDTIESNGLVNALVKELTKGDINYVAFTITATMTKDGKFVEIRHDGDGMIDAAAQTILGEVSGTGGIGFHARFYDFKY